jgi:hypothetical protein
VPDLVIGPLLRYADATDATIWVETDAACEAEVRVGGTSSRSRTFHVEGHHYAVVHVSGLAPGEFHEYEVALDGEKVWPESGSAYPPSAIRTIGRGEPLKLVFGSCRVSVPHEPPFTLSKEEDERGCEVDALYALTERMRAEPRERWPHLLMMLGDQIYADKISLGAQEFIENRRDTNKPPGEHVADFEEYTRLYRDAWGDPPIRWLLSTVSSAMIFDDHELADDWNISDDWVDAARAQYWWNDQIVGGYMSYWIYQHLGNLSPEDLKTNDVYEEALEAEDAGPAIRKLAYRAGRQAEGTQWSYHRDLGDTRLVVVDARAGRVLEEDRRSMTDDEEWAWISSHATGGFDHLLIGTSLPLFMGPGMHHLEAWNEALCKGAWGSRIARRAENLRQSLDLEHWSAFHDSFEGMVELLRSVTSGERGPAPRSVTVLSGDVHHSYLARVSFKDDETHSPVHQAVCSPFRNELEARKRRIFRAGWTRVGGLIMRALARAAGVREPGVRWNLTHGGVWFDNQVGTVELDGNRASLKFERAISRNNGEPALEQTFEHRLA